MCSRSCNRVFSEPTCGLKVSFVYVYKTRLLLYKATTLQGQHQKILANKQHKISDLLFTFQSGLHYVLCYMNHSQAVILSGTNWIGEKFKGFCL